MAETTEGRKKDLQDGVARAIHSTLATAGGDFYLEYGLELPMEFGAEPGVGDMASNQFEVLLADNNEQTPEGGPDGDGYEEWEEVLVVSVAWQRRRVHG